MRKDTLTPAPRRAYISPAMTLFSLSPREFQAASTSPDVLVDPDDPGDEALGRRTLLSEDDFDDIQ